MQEISTNFIILMLAFLPAMIWYFIFNKENPIKLSSSIFALLAWWLSTIPVLFYQKLWWFEWNFIFFKLTPVNFQDNIISLFGFSSFNSTNITANADYFSVAIIALFCAFLWVWLLEEFFKHVVINPRFNSLFIVLTLIVLVYYTFVTFSPHVIIWLLIYLVFLRYMPKLIKFRSIDDTISIAILAAIWFSFIENVIYFWYRWWSISSSLWIENFFEISFWSLAWFLGFVLIRVSVVTMIHILCSGVFGYHFWLAHFAKPELIEEIRQWRKHRFITFLHKILKTPEDKIFMIEQLMIALFLSILLHWIYDLVVQVNITVFNFPLVAIIMPLYFFGWFIYLFSLLENKNNKKEIWVLHTKEDYESE